MGLDRFTKAYQDKEFKKKAIIVGLVALIAGAFMLATRKAPVESEAEKVTREAKERSQKSVFETNKFNASQAQSIYTGDLNSNKDAWVVNGNAKLNEQSQTINQLITKQQSQEQQTNQMQIDQKAQIDVLNQKLDKMNELVAQQQQAIAMGGKNASGGVSRNNTEKPQPLIQEIDMDSDDDANSAGIINVGGRKPPISQDNKPKEEHKDISQYIPSNSFVPGNLIASLSANTGGTANSDPTPVLIRLTNLAQLPNFFRANVKNCMVGGNGYGDLSTERVKIRLTNLSCVLINGNTIDVPVKGYIAGEDGKAGIRGKVETHQGSVLAKAALAGFLQGLGQTAQNATQTQMISPIGTTTTVTPSSAVGNAAGSGASTAFSNLSTYYVNMLNQITPAIEVSSGRNVTVIFTEGISLKEKLGSTLDVGDELPFNKVGM
jgi:hypothetical protein